MKTILCASDFRRVEGTDRYTQVRHIPEDRIETGVYEVVPALVKGKLIAARVMHCMWNLTRRTRRLPRRRYDGRRSGG